MILQTDKRLDNNIQKSGCYLMCILFLCNKHRGFMLSTVVINRLYDILQTVTGRNKKPCLLKNCFVEDVERIFRHLDFNVKYTGKHELPDYMCKENEIEILCLRNIHNGSYHFVVGNGLGFVAYDPMGVSSKDYKLYTKRIFVIQE